MNVRLDHRSTKIIEYIYDNYSEDIDIVDISNEFKISPKSINKILVYYMEQNFRNFLTQVRIYKSCSLLLETDYSITEIASIVGFNSTKTFNRHFMKHILRLRQSLEKQHWNKMIMMSNNKRPASCRSFCFCISK